MSGPDDHYQEMSTHMLTDEAVEAFFSGRSHPRWEQEESLEPLAMLADDVALAVAGPAPRATHALLQLFWSTPAPRPDPEAHRAPAPRGRLRVAAGALLASVMAFAGVGVAGAVGALPAPVERVVNGVVEAVTPLELPEADGGGEPSDMPGGEPPASVPALVGGAPSRPAPASGPAPTSVPAPGAPVPTGADPAPQPPPAADPGWSPGDPGPPPATGLDRAGQAPRPPWAAPSGRRSPGPPPARP